MVRVVAMPELVLGKIRVGDVVDSASDMVGLDCSRTARRDKLACWPMRPERWKASAPPPPSAKLI
jgi:hypothetical protein